MRKLVTSVFYSSFMVSLNSWSQKKNSVLLNACSTQMQFLHLSKEKNQLVSRVLLANQTSDGLTRHFSNLVVRHVRMENKVGEIYWPAYALDSLSIIIVIKASVQQLLQL